MTANGREQGASLPSLFERVLHGQHPVVISSPRQRATETAALALPTYRMTVEPLVAEYDYGDYEGLTAEEIRQLAPGWDIWRDGCPHGESTADVGRRPDTFLYTHVEHSTQPEGADVEIDGDAEVQQAVRFGLFHVLQASAR